MRNLSLTALLFSLLCGCAHACGGAIGIFMLLYIPFLAALLYFVWWWADLTTRHLTPSCPRFLGALAGVVGYLYVFFSGALSQCMALVPWLPGLYSFCLFTVIATSFFAVLPGLALAAIRRRL